jgi:hypothetical protein
VSKGLIVAYVDVFGWIMLETDNLRLPTSLDNCTCPRQMYTKFPFHGRKVACVDFLS